MTTLAQMRRAAERRRADAQRNQLSAEQHMREIIARVRAEGRENLTAEEDGLFDQVHHHRDRQRDALADAEEQLAEIARAEQDDAEAARQSTRTRPTSAASSEPGRGYEPPGGRGVGQEPEGRGAPSGWVRSSDGRPATVERGQRFADHPVVAEQAARNYARERPVLDAHSGIGQLVRSMTTSTGSAIVPTMWASRIIDRARAYAQVLAAGTEVVPMDSKVVQIGRLTADPGAAGFRAEGSTITAGDPTFDSVTLTATTLSALTVASLEFMQDAINVDQVIEEAMAKAMGLALDLACIYGGITTGAEGVNLPAPPNVRGILANLLANLPANVLGAATNGTAITAATPWQEVLAAIYQVRRGNEEPNALLWPVRLQQGYANRYDTLNQPLRQPDDVAAITKLSTNQLASGMTQGTGTNMADLVVGDFTKAILGQRLDFTLRLLTERYADAGQVGIVGMWRGDFQLARPGAFAFYRYLQGA